MRKDDRTSGQKFSDFVMGTRPMSDPLFAWQTPVILVMIFCVVGWLV